MRIQDIIEGKKEWRAHVARVKALPQDYQIVYKEIQKYLYKVGPVELTDGIGLLTGIIDLFEEGAVLGKGILEVTGSDVAAFCDDLIKDSKTYADIYQESVSQEAMKKATDKTK
jgi:DNA-binding ferritin-like protein (Dps family)